MIAPRRSSSITIGAILLFAPTAVACTCDDGGPLNVFLLDGQSNMVRMGSLQIIRSCWMTRQLTMNTLTCGIHHRMIGLRGVMCTLNLMIKLEN
jgi:hypothetical protein